MNRWEYRQAPASASIDELNTLGADGWEVVGTQTLVEDVEGRRTEDAMWLLRRPAPAAAGMVTGD